MNAMLPQDRYESTIGTMPIGAEGYTVPWAMWPDMDGQLWINGNYTIYESPGGTVAMKVTRDEHGYIVDVTEGHAAEYRYSPANPTGDQFMGGADPLPVVVVIS